MTAKTDKSKRINILGVGFDSLTPEDAAAALAAAAMRDRADGSVPYLAVTPNPLMVMNALKSPEFARVLAEADLSVPDGTGIVGAAKRQKTPLKGRVTGIGTAEAAAWLLAAKGGSVFIFGGMEGRAEEALQTLCRRYPGLKAAGTQCGYYAAGTGEAIAGRIAAAEPDLLIVCLGSPAQELWAHGSLSGLGRTGAVICAGGAVDVWSGHIKRAPEAFIKLRLEWLWRMLSEPRRLRRLPELVRFRLMTSGKRR